MKQQGLTSTVRIRHVHLWVTDLERATAFYRDLLGFRVVVSGPAVGLQASFLAAGDYYQQIELNTAGDHHFTVLYSDRPEMAQVVGRLVRSAYPIDNAHERRGAMSVQVTDPDGHRIGLSYDRPRFDAYKRLAAKKGGPFDVRGLLIDSTGDESVLHNAVTVAARAFDRGQAFELSGQC
jgi:catechol 2,3-dioxygenase